MATIIADSIKYGIDCDGASCHDVVGKKNIHFDIYPNKIEKLKKIMVCIRYEM
jgi:hypothetical protein